MSSPKYEGLVPGPSNDNLDMLIHNWREGGWHFSAGDPEFWRFSDVLVKEGGKVLDIGIAYGGRSLFFALQGMEVIGYDINPDRVRAVNDMADELAQVIPFSMRALEADATAEDFGEATYDLALLAYISHFPSKAQGIDLVDRAYEALKPGGHIYIRAVGKEADSYTRLRSASAYDPNTTIVDEDVIRHLCACGGEPRPEPTLFFDQTELLGRLAHKGARIVHSQLIPEQWKMNIMFGEDFNPEQGIRRGGMITLLAQKPEQA